MEESLALSLGNSFNPIDISSRERALLPAASRLELMTRPRVLFSYDYPSSTFLSSLPKWLLFCGKEFASMKPEAVRMNELVVRVHVNIDNALRCS
jgi:hypothetical protein